jgi:hypothetical protein
VAYDVKSIAPTSVQLNRGRHKIILEYDEVTKDNVLEVLQKAIPWHTRNVKDCEYLIKYFLGDQDILRRQSPATSSINNQVVVNYALPITREIIGYTFGNPIEYVQKDVKIRMMQREEGCEIYQFTYYTLLFTRKMALNLCHTWR